VHTHESDNHNIANYYFMYGHYQIAYAIEHLDVATRDAFRAQQFAWLQMHYEDCALVFTQGEFGDHAASESYGTAMAVLALLARDRTPLARVTTTPADTFIRGDANGDGSVNIADAVTVLDYVFPNATSPLHHISPLDAADANDDNSVNVADAVYLLTYVFSSGPEPPAPFVVPGVDPTPSGLEHTPFW